MNEDNKFYIAGVRYLNLENNGIELSNNLSYVVVSKKKVGTEDIFYNVFLENESYPTFMRNRFYTNYTDNQESYGTKMNYQGGKLETGPCWILEGKVEDVSIKDIEDIVLSSHYYFKDRIKIAERRLKKYPIKLLKVLLKDYKQKEIMDKYFEKRKVKVLKKDI